MNEIFFGFSSAKRMIVGHTVQKSGVGIKVDARLFQVRTRQSAFGRQYEGSGANPRFYAHTLSDEHIEWFRSGSALNRLAARH